MQRGHKVSVWRCLRGQVQDLHDLSGDVRSEPLALSIVASTNVDGRRDRYPVTVEGVTIPAADIEVRTKELFQVEARKFASGTSIFRNFSMCVM